MKFNKWTLGLLAIIGTLAFTAPAQTLPSLPNIVGQTITIKGQSFLIYTNTDGSYGVSTFGTSGTNAFIVPATPDQAMQVATAWIEANNPANKSFYGTNEIDARLGAAYVQNSGQACAVLSVDKYGTFGWANTGFGAGLLQGNNAGKSGTAAAYAEAVYRKPIGDVAGIGGVLAGYDNWNKRPFGAAKAGLEYRQNAHLGEWLDAIYAFEGIKTDRGLMIAGGISYAF